MTRIPSPHVVRATVVADGATTDYLCVGSGPPLLLLARATQRDALIRVADAGFRALAPVVSARTGLTPDRLIDLLDGLGLWHVHLMADSEFESLARECVTAFPERFSLARLVR